MHMAAACGAGGLVLDLFPAGVWCELPAANEANKPLFSAFCFPILVKSWRIAFGTLQFWVNNCLYRGFHLTINPIIHYRRMKDGLQYRDITVESEQSADCSFSLSIRHRHNRPHSVGSCRT
jgi:hypothetical protein